jgi:hypothetical protein
VVLVAINPFVGGLAADAEPRCEFHDRQQPALVVADELDPLVHE